MVEVVEQIVHKASRDKSKTHDSDDELTEEQKRAIAENIRKMQGNFAAYTEKQEKDKYQDLRHVIPDLTDEEAVLALEYCQGNELEAIEQLRSQPAFVDAGGLSLIFVGASALCSVAFGPNEKLPTRSR